MQRPPRIALDLSPLAGRYPVSVVRTVAPILGSLRGRPDDVELIEVRPREGQGLKLWRQWTLPREARRRGADLIHCFGSAFPLAAGVPVIQTIHELPWLHGVRENAGLAHRLWVRLGLRRAARMASPSAFVARELEGLGATGVALTPWGVGPEFEPEERESSPGSGDYLLAPGATRPKKNLEAMARGAAAAGLPLRVTGAPTAYAEDIAARFPDTVELGEVADDELPRLYRGAAATLVLSRSEGVSLPVLESLRSGTPVLTSRGSSQSCTAGRFAIDVEPGDPEDVAAGVRRARAWSTSRRLEASAHTATATWARTAEALIQLWREVCP